MRLHEIKTIDLNIRKKYTFVLPLGSTEQHGPFLPLGTDTYIQNAILAGVIKNCPDAIFMPTLGISCSREHAGFPGTVWFEEETMLLMLRDICVSFKDYAKHIIMTSWHGGNVGVINRFIREQQASFSPVALHHVVPDPDDVVRQTEALIGGPVDEHAGNTEISMVLAAQEALVTIPPLDYPKQSVTIDWSGEQPVRRQTKDGIADPNPTWVIDKGLGERIIALSAGHLTKEIKRIMAS